MTFRVLLGFLIAFLGSLCLDEVIFKNDIDIKIAEYKVTAIEKSGKASISDYERQISDLEKIVIAKRGDWMEAQKHASEECDGTGGSKIPNRGPICNMKIEMAGEIKKDYQQETDKLNNLISIRDSLLEIAKTKASLSFNEKGLLMRIRALIDLVRHNKIMLIAYLGFTILIFFLEFLVVLIKMFSHETYDEKLERARDSQMEDKMKELMARRIQYRNSSEVVQGVQTVNQVLKQDHSRLLN